MRSLICQERCNAERIRNELIAHHRETFNHHTATIFGFAASTLIRETKSGMELPNVAQVEMKVKVNVYLIFSKLNSRIIVNGQQDVAFNTVQLTAAHLQDSPISDDSKHRLRLKLPGTFPIVLTPPSLNLGLRQSQYG